MSDTVQQPALLLRLLKNPISIRELRVSGRSWKILAALITTQCLQMLAFVIVLLSNFEIGGYEDPHNIGRWAFITQAILLLISVCLIFPAFSCLAIVSERERKSFDLLLLSHLSAWEIVWGKLVSAMASASLFLVSTVPFFALAISFGGVPTEAVVVVFLLLLLLSLMISAVGIYISVVIKSQVASVILTYITSLAIGILVGVLGGSVVGQILFAELSILLEVEKISAATKVYGLLVILAAVSLYFIFFFLKTVERLKAHSTNMSLAMRMYATIASAFVMLVLFTLPPNLSDVPYRVPVVLMYILVIAASILIPLAAIVTASGPAFPPRVLERGFLRSELRGPRRWLAWLFLPGATPGLVHTWIVIVLVALTVGWFGNAMTEARVQAADSRSRMIDELSRDMSFSMVALSQGNDDESTVRRAQYSALLSAISRRGPSITGSSSGLASTSDSVVREAMHQGGNFGWYLIGCGLIVAFGWSSLTWALGATRKPSRFLGLLIILMVAVGSIVTFLLSVFLEQFARLGLQAWSPMQLAFDARLLSCLDVLGAMDVSAQEATIISSLRDDSEFRVMRILGAHLIIGAAGIALGIVRRRKFARLRREHGDRWPVPLLPPPRVAQSSRQTGLGQQDNAQNPALALTEQGG